MKRQYEFYPLLFQLSKEHYEKGYLHHDLLAKRIELKCYYKTKSPLLDAKIDAFRMFLSRISKNQISEQLHQSNSNFLNILNQIHTAIPGDKQRNLKILERINEKEYLFDRDWLIEKAKMR